MFSTRQQSIPKCFIDKMAIDSEIAAVLKSKVVGIDALAPLIKKQRYLRQDCIQNVQKKNSFNGGTLA